MGSTDTGDYFPDDYNHNEINFSEGMMGSQAMLSGKRDGPALPGMENLGADAIMMGAPLAAAAEAPGRGFHWGTHAVHPSLPRGSRVEVGRLGTLEEILVGPAHENDGRLNLFGAVRTSMATTGHETLKEFQKAELVMTGSGVPTS